MGQWMATQGPVCGAPWELRTKKEPSREVREETRLWRGSLGTSRLKLGCLVFA